MYRIVLALCSFIEFAVAFQSGQIWSKCICPHLSIQPETANPIMEKLKYSASGYKWWNWNGIKVNYVEYGDNSKPSIILVHGFGASSYHWRYNIPALSKHFHVFVPDLIGFGLSDKPLTAYSIDLWKQQLLDFIGAVVSVSNQGQCFVAGNSLGGLAALAAAAESSTQNLSVVNGCILLNSAGSFRKPGYVRVDAIRDGFATKISGYVTRIIQRIILRIAFFYTKQPSRIAQVLTQVYFDSKNVDEELIKVRDSRTSATERSSYFSVFRRAFNIHPWTLTLQRSFIGLFPGSQVKGFSLTTWSIR